VHRARAELAQIIGDLEKLQFNEVYTIIIYFLVEKLTYVPHHYILCFLVVTNNVSD
jgi:hypothetical protein